jgi:hypothetical protein
MKITTSLCLVFSLASICFAAPKSDADADPFDLTKNQKQVDELGVPTVSSVQRLEDKALALYRACDWKNAAPALADYAKSANWLANLITTGLRPFYSASSRDQDSAIGQLDILVAWEKQANDLRQKRNRAMVMEAECYLKAGDKNKGLSLLLRVLELLPVTDSEYWSKARKMLYDMIEVK